MPTQYITLEETNNTILKSCYNDIIKEVVYRIGIPFETVVTVHNGVEMTKTDNRNNAVQSSDPNLPFTLAQRRLTAVVTDNYNEDSLTPTTVSQRDTVPIFIDYDIDCKVYPVYVKTDISINFEYTTPSKTEALRLRDDIRVKLSASRNILRHEVEYDIIIPEGVCDFIADIHELKSRLVPMELHDYFYSHATKRVHMLTDMTNPDNARLCVKERLVRIIGVMEFSAEPEPIEQDKETNTYKLTIPYKLSLDIPRGMCFSYPPMICNKPMPASYLQFVVERKLKTRNDKFKELSYTNSLGALSNFEVQWQLERSVDIDLPKNIPMFDEFVVREGHPGYVTLYTLLTDVDESDKRTLLNLRDLGDFTVDSKLLDFIQTVERPWIINPYMSYFYISLYQTGRHIDNNILEIDENFNVRSKKELSLLKPVRIAISVCLDTTYLNPTVQERMYSHPDMYLLYLSELVDGMRNFRQEFASMEPAMASFYRNFVLMLDRAVKRSDTEFIKRFIWTLSRDALAIQNLVGSLKHQYPRLYGKINEVVGLDRFKYTDSFKRDDIGSEMYAMRTMMLTSTQPM